jgi:hypothetical protein
LSCGVGGVTSPSQIGRRRSRRTCGGGGLGVGERYQGCMARQGPSKSSPARLFRVGSRSGPTCFRRHGNRSARNGGRRGKRRGQSVAMDFNLSHFCVQRDGRDSAHLSSCDVTYVTLLPACLITFMANCKLVLRFRGGSDCIETGHQGVGEVEVVE